MQELFKQQNPSRRPGKLTRRKDGRFQATLTWTEARGIKYRKSFYAKAQTQVKANPVVREYVVKLWVPSTARKRGLLILPAIYYCISAICVG